MRILHLLHTFPPESAGGTETYVRDLARAQRARGHRVLVGSGSELARASVTEEPGDPPVARLPSFTSQDMLGRDEGADRQLEALLDLERPDLVHLHHWHKVSVRAVAICGARGLPVVVSLHDLWTSCPLFFRLKDPAEPCAGDTSRAECARCVGRFRGETAEVLEHGFGERESLVRSELTGASAVLCVSASQREVLREVPWLADLEFSVLPLPPPASPPARDRSWPEAPERLRIATWGGLDPGKGLATLVEALETSAHAERFQLQHHGRVLDEELAQRMRARAQRSTLELNGTFRQDELPALTRSAELAAFPSLYLETHGFVVDEALLLDLPVLVSDRGAPKERVGARGRVLPALSVEAWRTELERLLLEPGALAELARGKAALGPPLDQHLDALQDVYARALRSGS